MGHGVRFLLSRRFAADKHAPGRGKRPWVRQPSRGPVIRLSFDFKSPYKTGIRSPRKWATHAPAGLCRPARPAADRARLTRRGRRGHHRHGETRAGHEGSGRRSARTETATETAADGRTGRPATRMPVAGVRPSFASAERTFCRRRDPPAARPACHTPAPAPPRRLSPSQIPPVTRTACRRMRAVPPAGPPRRLPELASRQTAAHGRRTSPRARTCRRC